MQRIHYLDSHTAGEPTRVVLSGGPTLPCAPLAEQVRLCQEQFDAYRRALVLEPRGSDVLVGAYLCQAFSSACQAGVIFFNNVGYLGMCGHGTIGVVTTLAHLGRLKPGTISLETPVGPVSCRLHEDGQVSVENVPSWREKSVTVQVPGLGIVSGEVAWGGNWFFLVPYETEPIALSRVDQLTEIAWRIRQAVNAQGYPQVDHIELVGPPLSPTGHARNFVLCPGKAYDRSPCGTGTSAKLACLAASGKLQPGETWVQESVLGSVFVGSYRWLDPERRQIVPTITGRAFITSEATCVLDPADPYCWGISG